MAYAGHMLRFMLRYMLRGNSGSNALSIGRQRQNMRPAKKDQD